MQQLESDVKRAFEGLNDDLKEIYNGLNKYSRAMEKV